MLNLCYSIRMIKNFIRLVLLFIVFVPTLYSAEINCSPRLKPIMEKIQRLPEARALIERVQREGGVAFRINEEMSYSQDFGAFWDLDRRTVNVSYNFHRSEADVIGSIIFELHNALATERLDRVFNLAMKRAITREQYVEQIERIEYENSHLASALVAKGIRAGIYPPEAHLNTYSSFEEHFHFQKVGGHSQAIAQSYDYLN